MPSLTCPADALGHPFRPTPATSSEGPGGCLSPWRPNPRPTPSTKRRFPIPRHFATLFRRRSPFLLVALLSLSPKRESFDLLVRAAIYVLYMAVRRSSHLLSLLVFVFLLLLLFRFSFLLRFFNFFDKIAEYHIFIFVSEFAVSFFFTIVYLFFFFFHIILEYLRD